jgi:hypothetical protein
MQILVGAVMVGFAIKLGVMDVLNTDSQPLPFVTVSSTVEGVVMVKLGLGEVDEGMPLIFHE